MKNLSAIETSIRDSDVGKKLLAIERWSKFRNDESTDQWIELLGPTAIVLTHQEYFVYFIMACAQNLPQDIVEMLVLAASVHDLGEVEVGDTASPDKTVQAEQEEHLQALSVIEAVGFDQTTELMLKDAYQQVVAGENLSLNFLFKSLERTEYLDTGIHLFRSLQSGQEMQQGNYMIARILAFDLPKIIDTAYKLEIVIGDYLVKNADTITQMFEVSRLAVEDDFRDRFDQSQAQWQLFLSKRATSI